MLICRGVPPQKPACSESLMEYQPFESEMVEQVTMERVQQAAQREISPKNQHGWLENRHFE